ncbi:MAG: serine/threonine protein kinase [Chloroflexi bacterium]|nr:MAG: serine/threonine protein kinase [Chloroflexota bacterium]
MLEQNDMLQDRYRIVKILGGGGMGQVYLAHDTRLADKPCAVKELIPDPHATPEEEKQNAAQFHQEAAVLAHLSHPNLPDVSDYFDERDRFYLVMDYVKGETTEQRMRRSPDGLPPEDVVEWAIQLCNVLEYLHSQTPPVIFRDMKPANVMLTPEEDIKLIDFGVARLFDPTKRTDTLKMGTAGYAPPEQYAGQGQTTPRSDVYALGVTMHELLTGDDPTAHPFVFTPPRKLNPAISPSLADVVMRAVKMDPDDRYPSITAMREALQKTTRPRRFRLPSIQRKSGTGTKVMPETAAVAAPKVRSRPAKFALGAARWLGRLALTAVIAVVVTALVLTLVGAFVLSSVAERAIGESDWDLEHSDPGPFVITEAELGDGMQAALEPYTLDAISHTKADFRPPDTAILSLQVLSNPVSLQGRVETRDGVPAVILERLNDVPLFVVGGIVSGGINRGFEQAWEDSRLRVTSITVQQRQLTINLELE